ncbi:hypothetical protein LINPERPRIM_LOCUS38371 [Linum perenne]
MTRKPIFLPTENLISSDSRLEFNTRLAAVLWQGWKRVDKGFSKEQAGVLVRRTQKKKRKEVGGWTSTLALELERIRPASETGIGGELFLVDDGTKVKWEPEIGVRRSRARLAVVRDEVGRKAATFDRLWWWWVEQR